MVAIGVFFPVAINATAGVLQISPIYLDVGKSFKASRWDTFRTIALPGALPFIMTGIKLGAGLALILIAIAEMVGAKSGIGYMIWSAWETFAVAKMYVGLFVIALIGFAISFILNESRALDHSMESGHVTAAIGRAPARRPVKIRIQHLIKRFRHAGGDRRRVDRHRGRHFLRDRRPVGLRQDHAAAHSGGPRNRRPAASSRSPTPDPAGRKIR